MRSTRAAFKRTAESTSTACDAETIDPTLFPLGCLVHVTGLVVALHHNGKAATVCGNQAGRFHVLLDDGVQLAVKPINLRLAASAAFDVLSFTNRLTGRRVSLALVADGTLQSPGELCAQIKHQLKLINAAAWIFAMQSDLPSLKPYWEEHPLRHRVWEPGTQFPPSLLVLLMCGRAISCRLAITFAGVYVIRKTTSRWVGWIMERVTRGRVSRVQVPEPLCRRVCCAVRCSYRASAYVRFVFDA